MTKTLICELAVAVSLASGGAISRIAHLPTAGLTDHQQAIDGAFRDGLYVGRLTAESGRASRPPIGRWSTNSDRVSFLAGYRQGYAGVFSGPSGNRSKTE